MVLRHVNINVEHMSLTIKNMPKDAIIDFHPRRDPSFFDRIFIAQPKRNINQEIDDFLNDNIK